MANTLNTVNKPDMQRLAFMLTDPNARFVYPDAFPAFNAGDEVGKWRKKDVRAFFEETRHSASKFTVPETSNTTDSFLDFHITPIARGFQFSRADLGNPQKYGHPTAASMIEEELAINTFLMKKIKEKALSTFVDDNSNYASASHYADAATAWSSVDTADSLDDITAGRTVIEAAGYSANAGIISQTAFRYLQQHATIQSASHVSGPRRDGQVDPTITPDFLKNYWQLDHLWIARGSLITDSSDPTDETTAEIWGDKMLLFQYDTVLRPRQPSWMKHLFWQPDGKGDPSEGWFVNETFEPRPGGVGVTTWDMWNYYTYLSHYNAMAYRIDNLY
jgi:hypothetical protein